MRYFSTDSAGSYFLPWLGVVNGIVWAVIVKPVVGAYSAHVVATLVLGFTRFSE